MKLNEMKLDDLLYMNLHMLSKKLFNTIYYKEVKKEHFTLTEKVKLVLNGVGVIMVNTIDYLYTNLKLHQFLKTNITN